MRACVWFSHTKEGNSCFSGVQSKNVYLMFSDAISMNKGKGRHN